MSPKFPSDAFDLTTPDGFIHTIHSRSETSMNCSVEITQIDYGFKGFHIDSTSVFFNLKSTLAQLGVHSITKDLELSLNLKTARVNIDLIGVNPLGVKLLTFLEEGAYIGKLFAADERRRVREPFYLLRMFGRSDRLGRPLLSLGGLHGSDELILKKVEGRAVAFLKLNPGVYYYDQSIEGLLPALARALKNTGIPTRRLVNYNQTHDEDAKRIVQKNELLLVRTFPLHIRTVFAKVVNELLPKGFEHTSACVLQPDTHASGDVYELFGESQTEIADIPLEFYTLEPYREHVFFEDRDQLQTCLLEDPKSLFNAMETAPTPSHHKCASFIVKGEQLLNLNAKDWILQETVPSEFPGFFHPERQALLAEKYIEQQPSYPFLKGIQQGNITSQGILLTRYFPSPLMKRHLLSEQVYRNLKGIYFSYPSRDWGEFFSHEDRSLLLDLAKFGIPIFWLDQKQQDILQYVPKPGKDSGMFVPLKHIQTFIDATMLGIYGSNLIEGDFEAILREILEGLEQLKLTTNHSLLNPKTPLALVTGGGPGVMSLGNRVAREVGILSCANIVDFTSKQNKAVNEQNQNPYIDAKMTFRLDRLVERQAEFHLDLPIFLMGGIGTDFEYALEEVRRKVGSVEATPVLLIGPKEYWKDKITSRFQNNLHNGTIAGSEWVSNCFYCVQTAAQALQVYQQFFMGKLPIGPKGKVYEQGFNPSFSIAEES